jgi:hypothetical protein
VPKGRERLPLWLTVDHVGALLARHRRTIELAIADGKLRATRGPFRDWRLRPGALAEDMGLTERELEALWNALPAAVRHPKRERSPRRRNGRPA